MMRPHLVGLRCSCTLGQRQLELRTLLLWLLPMVVLTLTRLHPPTRIRRRISRKLFNPLSLATHEGTTPMVDVPRHGGRRLLVHTNLCLHLNMAKPPQLKNPRRQTRGGKTTPFSTSRPRVHPAARQRYRHRPSRTFFSRRHHQHHPITPPTD
jgi:hypothetical protein